ncbi:MAG TPA: cytochrome c [Hymenobacter sp.]|jgi:mono/diheme cytochrome c family protein
MSFSLFKFSLGLLLCGLLELFLLSNAKAQSKSSVTYTEDIAPLIVKHCASCHRSGGEAPFPLLTYEEVNSKAHTIVAVTTSGYMPPWRADPHYRSFANERLLSPEQVALIRRWVETGAPKGPKRKAQSPVASAKAIAGPTPDLVLRPTNAFRIKGNNTENFVLYKIPFELPAGQAVRAIEFIPGNRRLVHHANYAVQAVAADIDIRKGSDYVVSDQFLTNMREYLPFMSDLVHYGGWVPGTSRQDFPSGVGFTMPIRGVILLTVHYGPSPIDTTDLSTLKLFYTRQPIRRPLQAVSIGSAGSGTISPPLIIPADSIKSFEASWQVKDDVSLLYIWPHMHLLGQKFKAWAVTPTGETIPLVNIPAWDFRWQESYRCRQMIHLPAGSTVIAKGTYDNTSRNINNPFSPPRRIISQDLMESQSEMLNLVLLMLPYEKGDEDRVL